MIPKRPTLKADRPKQETPGDLVGDLMTTIREVYCPDRDDKSWFKDDYRRVREWCVLWPARFVVQKGFTLPADRFKEVLLFIITDSKRHATGRISYLPAFLGKCVQSHFQKHWETYYKEAKSLQKTSEAALLALKQLPVADRTVDNLAAVHQVLSATRKKAKTPEPAKQQMSLF